MQANRIDGDRRDGVGELQLDAMPRACGTLAVILGQLTDEAREIDRLQLQAWLAGLEPGEREQILEDEVEAIGVALDRAEKTITVGFGDLPVPVDQRLDEAFDHAKRCAQLVGDVGHEVLAHGLELFLAGDLMEHAEHPAALAAIPGGDDGAGCLNPGRGVAGARELKLDPIRGSAAADIIEKRGESAAVDEGFDALSEAADRFGEERGQGLVGEDNLVRIVDGEHAFLETAERGFDLVELAGAGRFRGAEGLDKVVGGVGGRAPVGFEGADDRIDQVRRTALQRGTEIAVALARVPQEFEKQQDAYRLQS